MTHPLKGRPQSPEHIARRVAARHANDTYKGHGGHQLGVPLSAEHNAKFQANRHPRARFAGDQVGWKGAHDRARAALRGQLCMACGATETQAALIAGCGKKYAERPGRRQPTIQWYSPDPEDYMPLCPSCHRRYDLAVA